MPPAPSQGGKEGEQWVRVIDGALQEWEAENRKHGGDRSNVCDTDDDPRDQESARGIRRRIQKRAIAGDDQAQAKEDQPSDRSLKRVPVAQEENITSQSLQQVS